MSLHTLAKHVQEKGRGNDQMLVHMTPKEVQGLQALAKAHGGSLTINPETGLPEAGFLEQVLPIVAMAAATYFTAGAAAPALSAALAGEGALAAGAVTAGGGALAGGLAGAGVGALGAGIQGKDVGKGALYGGIGGAIAGGMGAYGGPESAVGDAAKTTSEASQSIKAVEGVNSGQQLTDVTKQMANPDAGAGAGVSGYGEANALPNGAPNPNPDGLPYNPGSGYGSAQSGPPTPQQLADTKAFTSQPPIKPGDPSYYSTITTPGGKLATQALPGVAADIGMNTPGGIPSSVNQPYTNESTLSPNFQGYTPRQPKPYYQAQYTRYAAQGGLMSLAPGGPVEQMSQNIMGGQGNMFPQSQQEHTNFATPTQMPASAEVIRSDYDAKTNPYTGVMMATGGLPEDKKKKQRAALTADRTMAAMSADQAGLAMLNNARYGANMTGASPMSSMTLGDLPANAVAGARGGLADLGSYSDGGRLLKGPGDGMSDHIPAQIGSKQPARLADGEFVVPADVVSHLGNGSTDAGAKRLYAMMDKVRQARTGKKKQAPAVNTARMMPA